MRVFDRWTCNQTCFNAARALRPLNNGEVNPVTSVEMPVGSKVPECDFCTPLDYTAAGNIIHTQTFKLCSQNSSLQIIFVSKQVICPARDKF